MRGRDGLVGRTKKLYTQISCQSMIEKFGDKLQIWLLSGCEYNLCGIPRRMILWFLLPRNPLQEFFKDLILHEHELSFISFFGMDQTTSSKNFDWLGTLIAWLLGLRFELLGYLDFFTASRFQSIRDSIFFWNWSQMT